MIVELEIEDGPVPMVAVRFAARHIAGLDMKDTTDRRAWGAPPESVLTVDVADGSTLSLKDVGDFELMRRLTRLAFPIPTSVGPRARKPLIGTRRRST